jgi:hypothetical protein
VFVAAEFDEREGAQRAAADVFVVAAVAEGAFVIRLGVGEGAVVEAEGSAILDGVGGHLVEGEARGEVAHRGVGAFDVASAQILFEGLFGAAPEFPRIFFFRVGVAEAALGFGVFDFGFVDAGAFFGGERVLCFGGGGVTGAFEIARGSEIPFGHAPAGGFGGIQLREFAGDLRAVGGIVAEYAQAEVEASQRRIFFLAELDLDDVGAGLERHVDGIERIGGGVADAVFDVRAVDDFAVDGEHGAADAIEIEDRGTGGGRVDDGLRVGEDVAAFAEDFFEIDERGGVSADQSSVRSGARPSLTS